MERRLTEGEEAALREHLEMAAVQLYADRRDREPYRNRAWCHPTKMRYFGGRGAKLILTPVADLRHYELVDIYPDGSVQESVIAVHEKCIEGLGLPKSPESWDPMLVYVEEARFYDRSWRYKPRDDPTEGMPIGVVSINVMPARPASGKPAEEPKERAPPPEIPAV